MKTLLTIKQAPSSIKSFLSSVVPLNRIPPNEIDNLIHYLKEITQPKGTTIFTEGEKTSGVWLLNSGRIDIFKYTSGGKPTAIECITAKQWYGTLCRIGGRKETYSCTAVAAVDSISFKIEERAFWSLLDRYPLMVKELCALCSKRLSEMQELVLTTQETVDKRIIKTLLHLAISNGPNLPFSKKEISEFAATTPETAIRILNQFEKKEWIFSRRGQIVLKKIDDLRSHILN